MTPEGKVKKKVKDVLKKLGAYYVMPIGSTWGNSGVPDFIFCLKGKFYAIECKAGRNTPTALQEKNMSDIWNAGGVALLINELNVEKLEELLK
jgi:Holliday junction resolvase